jgi:hypothetical protein
MADLSIGSSSGAQGNTQSPQGLVSSGTSTAAGSNVQPGTATTLLTTPTGVSLHPTQLATISLTGATTPVVSASSASSSPSKHHISSGLLGISIGLAVIAVVVFVMITRSAKNTTNYN